MYDPCCLLHTDPIHAIRAGLMNSAPLFAFRFSFVACRCIQALEGDLKRSLDWFESEPSLWVVILTGKGRAFCAGQDLKDWLSRSSSFSSSSPGPESAPATSEPSTVAASSGLSSADMESVTLESENTTRERMEKLNRGGFGSVSSRRSKKPIVAAVDGICLGGGTEMVVSCACDHFSSPFFFFFFFL